MEDTTLKSCREFVSLLASAAPAPGGGGAAALSGALAAALGHMVGALTVGKQKYAPVEAEIRAQMDRLSRLSSQLLDQVTADAEGFLPLAKAYAIPKDDPNRAQALEQATLSACQVPMAIMELCVQALESVAVLAEKGSRLAVSDAGCAAALAKAALQAASLNVFINTKSLADRTQAHRLNEACTTLLEGGEAQADEIFAAVKSGLLR